MNTQIPDKDLKIQAGFHGNPGGQQVATTSVTVRITHLPTGLMVQSESGHSQGANRDVCLAILEHGLREIVRYPGLT